MESLLAGCIGFLTACGVFLLLRGRTFPVVVGLTMLAYAVNLFLFSFLIAISKFFRSLLNFFNINKICFLLLITISRHIVGSEDAILVKSLKPLALNLITSDFIFSSNLEAVPTIL